MTGKLLLLVVSICALGACGTAHRDYRGDCTPGATQTCYTGAAGTEDVGPCHAGMQTCDGAGMWGSCEGQVVPTAENCSDGIDNNCNGMVDEIADLDGDGFPTCDAAGHTIDCCDGSECSNPAEVNPGAIEIAGDGVDNDCDGIIDNAPLPCDQGLASDSHDPLDYAKAIDLCQMATMADRKWGVLDAKLTLPDGTGMPDPNEYSIRPHFGTQVMPQVGARVALISSGVAAGKGDTAPAYHTFESYQSTKSSGFPADFLAANGGKLPNAPGCPSPDGSTANDPVMLTLKIRVPTNAHSFSLASNFFSAEFPEWTCSPYNDFFVVLLDSSYAGDTPNPTDKNLAFYQPPGTTDKVPVGVNLAYGNTGLFAQCVNGHTGCGEAGPAGTIVTCTAVDQLQGTGFDDAAPDQCDANSLVGGASGWLTIRGNVVPGEIITLRIAIWDTSDRQVDSLAVIDAFTWSADPATPGTVILRNH